LVSFEVFFRPFWNISRLDSLTMPKMLVESKYLKSQIKTGYQLEPFLRTLLIIEEMSSNNKIAPTTKEIHEI